MSESMAIRALIINSAETASLAREMAIRPADRYKRAKRVREPAQEGPARPGTVRLPGTGIARYAIRRALPLIGCPERCLFAPTVGFRQESI